MSITVFHDKAARGDVKVCPMSLAQEGLWLLEQLTPESALNTLSMMVHVRRTLTPEVLAQSLNTLVQRHDALRTTFQVLEGQPLQVIAPSLSLPLAVVDLRAVPEEKRQAEAQRLASQEARRPFDLAQGPLLRISLLQLGAEEHVLLLSMHRMVCDRWSMGVCLRELARLYEAFASGQPSPLPALPMQYTEFALRQQEWLQGDAAAAELAYWKQQLDGSPAGLDLPGARQRQALPSLRSETYDLALPRGLGAALRELSQQEGVSLEMTLVAALQSLLQRYSGQEDLMIGTVAAGRTQVEREGLIGLFSNRLALRCDLAGDPSFREVLGRVREVVLGAQAHLELPFEYLVKELHPTRALGHNPFFQVMLTLAPPPALPPGWVVSQVEVETGTSRVDLSLDVEERAEGLLARFQYSSDLFDEATIARLAGHWQRLLEGIVANSNQPLSGLPLLTEQERHQLLVEWNATQTEYPQEKVLHQLFEAQVERTPEAVAVVCEDQQLTYRELNRRANQLAHHLRDLGVGPDTLVVLLAERDIPFLISILAVFKAGGAYLPLDPRHPDTRLHLEIEHSCCSIVLATTALASTLSHALTGAPSKLCPRLIYFEDLLQVSHSAENIPICTTPRHLAYVIYTSGSTGMPKGAMVEHRGMLNHIYAKIDALDLTAIDSVAQTAPQCFDISVWQFLSALLVGGRVQIYPDEVASDPVQLLTQVEQHQVSILETVPSLLRAMLDTHETDAARRPGLRALRWLIPTGEALPVDLCRRWLGIYPHVPLLNAYGPTECSDDVTHYPIYKAPDETRSSIPIGRAIPNMRLYVLDRRLEPLPIGVSGELYVGGIGVGRGYLGDERRTTEAFVPDPFVPEPGAHLYKTGDLARYLPDGNIEFLGRLDFQVKMRGFRIELGEIEAVLGQHPAVRQALVVAREDAPGDKRLVAYIVLQKEESAATLSGGQVIDDLKSHVMKLVPAYMVPSTFVLLETLPLTSNGKIDRHALPAPDYSRSELEGSFVAPRTPLEEVVAASWSQILGIEQIGIHDNFFALGGNSLLAVQVTSRIRTVLQVEVPLRRFFEAPTVAQLTEVITQLKAQDHTHRTPALRRLSRDAYRMPTSSTPTTGESTGFRNQKG